MSRMTMTTRRIGAHRVVPVVVREGEALQAVAAVVPVPRVVAGEHRGVTPESHNVVSEGAGAVGVVQNSTRRSCSASGSSTLARGTRVVRNPGERLAEV
jgi:hypothetical protein